MHLLIPISFQNESFVIPLLTFRRPFSSRKSVFVLLLVPQTRFRVFLIFFASSCTSGTIYLSRSLSCAMITTPVCAHPFHPSSFPRTHSPSFAHSKPPFVDLRLCRGHHLTFQYICHSCSYIFTVVFFSFCQSEKIIQFTIWCSAEYIHISAYSRLTLY